MRNKDASGPLRHRLSEPPETPTGPPVERQAGAPPSPPADALGLRAAALINSLPRPAELSPSALVRIRERIESVAAPAPARPWWQWAAASTAAVGAAALAVLLLPRLSGPSSHPGELVVRELRLPASGVAQLRTGPGSELLLVGPGSLTRPAGAASQVAHLADGRLIVRAVGEDVVIDAAGRRVTIPKGHLAEVVVHLGDLMRVAAYVGDSRLLLGPRELLLHQGTAWTRDGEQPLAVECRGLVAAALAGGPWPGAGPCSDGAAVTAPAATVVTALTVAPEHAPAGSLHPHSSVRVARLGALAPPPGRSAAPSAAAGSLVGPTAVEGPATGGLAAESRLLGIALHQLHQERDGGAALRSLDSYQQRFPSGLLTEEAQAARIDALLLLSHRSEALALLDHTQFQRLGRGGELRVVRAELRATSGRCREALADFTTVLSGTAPPPPVVERALYGQASCLAELGNPQQARAAFNQYLTRFPTGRFAEAARRSLQTLQPSP